MNSQIPEFPEFTNITCNLIDELKQRFIQYNPIISEYSIGFLFGYSESLDLKITKIYDNICIFGNIDKIPSFLPPIGDNKISETIELCLSFMYKNFKSGRINAVCEKLKKLLESNSKFIFYDDRNNYDYIYRIKDLSNLSGEKYQAKRNLVKQFKKRYKFEFKELKDDIINHCKKLNEKWRNQKNWNKADSILIENNLINTLLDNFKNCRLFGSAIVIDGDVQAFTIAEQLNRDTAVTHIEIANTEYKGIYQTINNLFAKYCLKNFKYVNREQDAGDEGLRKAKLSYHPCFMIKKYNILFNDKV